MLFSIFADLIDDPGDLHRFEKIYNAYAGQMYQLALSILTNHHEAEDAVQNALLGIAKTIRTVPRSPEKLLRAYVLTAARNAALSLLPQHQRNQSHVDIQSLSLPDGEDMFQALLQSQQRERLERSIARLPQLYREVLMLRYIMDLKPRQIAQSLNRPITTVSQQLRRAKLRLAQIYQEEEEKP